ncbi:hypothetical protein [Pseudomonas gingeri]|uniref:hypothetical protein n=1 Tax=Pseudomonas gingeri TaxID=117681 RepID=UPI0015A2FEF9|nr:hypothetical protein [Pseudomonas gingeri]NWA11933.1 hypothetical protein [Pseudomonas gingeri]
MANDTAGNDAKASPPVKTGEKSRLTLWLDNAQIERVRLLATAKNLPQSTIIGDLIDTTEKPQF